MNGTPRLGSSYPSTPDSSRKTPTSSETSTPSRGAGPFKKALPVVPQPVSLATTAQTDSPLIPLTLIDAPSQRFYILAFYIALVGWRLYDWAKLVEDEADSLWLFIKWVAMDAVVFLYGLPALRIPWLEWSNPTIMTIFLLHAVMNGMLMFRIPIPLEALLASLVKTLYDRELSISENRVKPASILHNSSLIMGKQIINVLPEGSATLNALHQSFCIDTNHPSAKLPISFNETVPIHIELLRIDFESGRNETIEIKGKEVKNMISKSSRQHPKEVSSSLVLEYSVKKPGLYRLLKVVDVSNLEVQRRVSDTLVVVCPRASIKPTTADRCQGELSDLTIEVKGTPPMKIVYSRTVNREDQSFHFQSIQPENLVSPLLGSSPVGVLVSGLNDDVSWGRSDSIDVRLNESMTTNGKWVYAIDEVHDAVGNIANFSADWEDNERMVRKRTHLQHAFTVHERPLARLIGCDTHNSLKFALGASSFLPVEFGLSDYNADNPRHTVTWKFSPIDKLTATGEHGEHAIVENFTSKGSRKWPEIHQAGLYTLLSVANEFCEGEVKEPASCLVVNPPEPDLSITSEDIYDKCAGNAIGFLVDMDLTGTPPFVVHYEIIQNKQRKSRQIRVDGSRHQIELKPADAGHFTYRFTSIEDRIYGAHALNSQVLMLEQDVKPPASALIMRTNSRAVSCIEEAVHFNVVFQGEPPFTLEYELIHNGKRKKQKRSGIEEHSFAISTEPLNQGGDYAMTLASVQDKTGCKIFLDDEIKIKVRQQRPKASFGLLDGRRNVMALEGERVRLPLRLEGVPPWYISYRMVDDSPGQTFNIVRKNTNDVLEIDKRGIYELVNVSDSHCPGTVDPSTASVQVDWIPRPEIRIADKAGLKPDGEKYWKREICEGDVDAVEISLIGSPPYHLEYRQRHKPDHGSASFTKKEIDVALGVTNIAMDTTKAGLHIYEFFELSDNFYNTDLQSKSLVVQQMVNPKPVASFMKPGHSYTYCKAEEAGDEVILISLQGLPPFSLEIDIKHQSSSRPETVKIANVETNHYEFRIPHRVLSLGTHHVSVRKVRDSRGCQRKTEYGAPHVQVQVFDVPTIYPLETRTDYCVGDRISYTLSGTPPFEIYYTFDGVQRKAKLPNTNFKRIAEKPGEFTITAVSDKASECKAPVEITKQIHEMPSVKISKGRQVQVDIHEGGEAEILFEFGGTPPFEFTYTRSTNAKKGQKSRVLETRHEISYEYSKAIRSSQEGTYEVVAVKDKFCAFSTQRVEAKAVQKPRV